MCNVTNFAAIAPKAWDIRAYTLEGAAYCLDCSIHGDAAVYGAPVFMSDEFEASCDSCHCEI